MITLRKSIYVTILFIGILLISCGGSDDSKPTEDPIDNTFTATVAEASVTAYNANSAKGVLTKGSVPGPVQYTLYVEGKESGTNRLINFFIYSATEQVPGTFYLKINNSNQAYYIENYDTASAKAWIAPDYSNGDPNVIHGTIILTEITANRAKGTFSFTAKEDGGSSLRTVTNGTFDVAMTRQGF